MTAQPPVKRSLLVLCLLLAADVSADTVRGVVTDLDRMPLAGANVSVTGTRLGAVTDERGEYRIAGVPSGEARLRASRIGYLTARSGSVDVSPAGVTVDFVLRAEPIEMSPVVIAASAIGEDVRRAPNRAEIVDLAEIRRAPARNTQEVLQSVEGLYLTRGEGLSITFPQIIVRGMSTGYLGRSTAALMMLNGHSINGSLGSWANVGDLDAIPLGLVQKVEVMKGPYTSVYGSGATGGVINVLTRRHYDRPVGGSLQVGVGPASYRSVEPFVAGQRDRVTYAAWGEFLHGGERLTRRRATWDSAANGYLAKGRVEHSKYGFLLGYDVTAQDRVDVLANHLEKYINYEGRPISYEQITGDLVHVTFTRHFDDRRRLTVLGNLLDTAYDGPGDARPASPDSNDWRDSFQRWPNRELGMKAVYSGSLAGVHDYAAGLEWRRNTNETTKWYGDKKVLDFDITGTQDIYSAFAEDKVRIGRLEVTPGVRLEQWKDNALYSRQEDLPDDAYQQVHVGYDAGRDTREAVNPKLGLAWFAQDDLKLRASVGSTFRAPRITETYSRNYTTLAFLQYRANLDLEPERILSYEAGVDFQSADRRLDLSLTGFYVDARDRIEFTFLGGFTVEDPFVIQHKNFDQKIPGVEGEVGYWIWPELGAGANASFVSPEYTSGTFDGNTPPGVPDHTINAHLDWTPRSDLSARLALMRVGAIWDDNENTAELDPYQLVNLKLHCETALGAAESVYLEAELTNLLDEDYQVYANRVWDYAPEGRALHLALGYGF